MATPAEVQLATRLRALREEQRLKQSELAAIFSAEGNAVGAAAISAWENTRRPARLPQDRVEPYSRLAALTGTPRRLTPLSKLSEEQKRARDQMLRELQRLVDHAREGSTSGDVASYRSWFFADGGPVIIIAPDAPPSARGPLADETDPNYTDLHNFADLDALIELHGHVRAENEPNLRVNFVRASLVDADHLSGHVVLLGGIAWNPVSRRLLRELRRLPVQQVDSPDVVAGDAFAVGHGEKQRRFLPTWSAPDGDTPAELEEDVALLARVRNPYNSSKTLTLCNGIHSRGVLGAVRALTDARIRASNEKYLAEHYPDGEYGLLLRVPVFRGEALSPDLQNPLNILYAWPDETTATPGRHGQ